MLEEAISSAAFFLDPGSVILQRVSMDGTSHLVSSSRARVWDGGIVMLVNQGTGGPAEAFVAALRAHQVGKVVGTRTAGNAGLPSFHELGSGLVMQLTEEFMRGPMGGEWSGQGLVPDVVVEPVNFMLDPRPGVAPPDLQRDAAIHLMSPP
jgi:carboxyl-terminal processing protease